MAWGERTKLRIGALCPPGLILLACMHVAPAAGDEEAAARGRRLFETGIGRNGQSVQAVFAESATPIPGTLLSCAGCHGKDGKGRLVKGADPPDISWQTLTKPYSLQIGAGRARLPYTDALVVRAVTIGRDSSGQVLAPAMPRFRLTPGDAADLVAYLRELGSKPDPGITAETITLGVLLPRREQLPATYDAVRGALGSYRDALNRTGIFGRRIEFAFIEATANPDLSQSATRMLTLEQTVLAVLVSDTVGVEHNVTLLTKQHDVPLVAPSADKDLSPARHVFYLSAGVTGELGALAAQAARQLNLVSARLAVVYRENDESRDRMAALRPLIKRNGWSTIDEVALITAGDDVPDQAMRRIEAGDAILFADWDRRSARILSRLGQAGRNPLVLLAGSLAEPESLPHDISAQTRILFAFDFIRRLPASADTLDTRVILPPPEIPALTGLKLLVEGLRRAGRDISRAKLIDALETIQRFDAGNGSSLSFGPRQHVGFVGAQIVPFDPRRLEPMAPVSRIQLD